MTAPGALADPRVRLGAGTVALLVTAVAVHHDRVGPSETAAFRAINGLPGSLYRPAWAVMQLGTLGAVPVTAAAAWLGGNRELAGRLLAGGTGAWALSKVVKRMVRRPRPAALPAAAGPVLPGAGPDGGGLPAADRTRQVLVLPLLPRARGCAADSPPPSSRAPPRRLLHHPPPPAAITGRSVTRECGPSQAEGEMTYYPADHAGLEILTIALHR